MYYQFIVFKLTPRFVRLQNIHVKIVPLSLMF